MPQEQSRLVLLAADRAFLEGKGYEFQVTPEGGLVCVVIQAFRLPPGYEPEATDLLLRLPPGFPDAQPDMYWCDPPVRLAATQGYPVAADQFEQHLGRNWQRFSRHLPPGVWQPGRDTLESYLTLIRSDLARQAR